MQQTVILNGDLVKQVLKHLPAKNIDDLLNIVLEEYLKNHQEQEDEFENLLNKTRGIWQQGDGLDYQINVRENWN